MSYNALIYLDSKEELLNFIIIKEDSDENIFDYYSDQLRNGFRMGKYIPTNEAIKQVKSIMINDHQEIYSETIGCDIDIKDLGEVVEIYCEISPCRYRYIYVPK